jgi:beta-lactamase class D
MATSWWPRHNPLNLAPSSVGLDLSRLTTPLHLTAARLRLGVNLKGHIWAAADARVRQKENMKYLLVILLLISQVHAADWEESPKVAELFKSVSVNGTFVLYDVTAQRFIGHDQTRAEKKFIPASTFKIPHTLIGLSVGAVKSVGEVLPYGGKPQPFKTWERDMGLRDAIAMSNAAIYQELARRIGLDQMRINVSKLGYGNEDIGTSVDTFWLLGPLSISAVGQTQFLAKLAQEALPYPQTFQEKVREIIFVEKSANGVLYGKTGWENAPGPGVGWWVGWVQKDNRI